MHTPGPWRVGKVSTVVSDSPLEGVPPNTGHSDVDYYGGYLIGESIFRKDDAALIAAAPELLASLKALFGYIESGVLVRNITKDSEAGWAMKLMPFVMDLGKAQAAIAKAEQA